MIRYTITFETGNAAFRDDFNGTVDLLLQQAATKIKHESGLRFLFQKEYALHDANGNAVGTVEKTLIK